MKLTGASACACASVCLSLTGAGACVRPVEPPPASEPLPAIETYRTGVDLRRVIEAARSCAAFDGFVPAAPFRWAAVQREDGGHWRVSLLVASTAAATGTTPHEVLVDRRATRCGNGARLPDITLAPANAVDAGEVMAAAKRLMATAPRPHRGVSGTALMYERAAIQWSAGDLEERWLVSIPEQTPMTEPWGRDLYFYAAQKRCGYAPMD